MNKNQPGNAYFMVRRSRVDFILEYGKSKSDLIFECER